MKANTNASITTIVGRKRRGRKRRSVQDRMEEINTSGFNNLNNLDNEEEGIDMGDEYERDKKTRGGGVAIYLQKHIDVRDTQISQLDKPDTEQV